MSSVWNWIKGRGMFPVLSVLWAVILVSDLLRSDGRMTTVVWVDVSFLAFTLAFAAYDIARERRRKPAEADIMYDDDGAWRKPHRVGGDPECGLCRSIQRMQGGQEA